MHQVEYDRATKKIEKETDQYLKRRGVDLLVMGGGVLVYSLLALLGVPEFGRAVGVGAVTAGGLGAIADTWYQFLK